MENLSEKVYECTLAVEAHMICDLLGRAGISARVDGEFLAGAGGELPLGSAIKVRVDPSRAAEAREVIDEWERLQPSEASSLPPPRPRWRSPLWFAGGIVIGALLMFWALRARCVVDSADWNGDGVADEIYVYSGRVLDRVDSREFDKDGDGVFERRVDYDRFGEPIAR